MTKAEIMKAANIIIEGLMYCDDIDFIDRVAYAIMNGEEFADEEIEEIDEEEYLSILLSLLKKKVRTVKASNDYERNGKLIRFAAGHGYELDAILSCLRRMGCGDEYME